MRSAVCATHSALRIFPNKCFQRSLQLQRPLPSAIPIQAHDIHGTCAHQLLRARPPDFRPPDQGSLLFDLVIPFGQYAVPYHTVYVLQGINSFPAGPLPRIEVVEVETGTFPSQGRESDAILIASTPERRATRRRRRRKHRRRPRARFRTPSRSRVRLKMRSCSRPLPCTRPLASHAARARLLPMPRAPPLLPREPSKSDHQSIGHLLYLAGHVRAIGPGLLFWENNVSSAL